MKPETLDRWFTVERQQQWVSQLTGSAGLTRRRAECFVRIWAYLYLKQSRPLSPLLELKVPQGWIPCTHQEAAVLFYQDQDRGSERAAGLMLDKLVALGLLQKQFDGNSLCWQVFRIPDPLPVVNRLEGVVADAFSPRLDAVPVANLLAANYNWLNKNSSAAPVRIARLLRQWAQQYPKGLRVLRSQESQTPVGFLLLYPTAPVSEACFFSPPSRSLHLSSGSDLDPIQMAEPGDLGCQAVFVRSFVVDPAYTRATGYFLKDAQHTLQAMQHDFPNLADMHTIVIHPSYEQLAQRLGFQKSYGSGRDPLSWMFLPLDRYLGLDIDRLFPSQEELKA